LGYDIGFSEVMLDPESMIKGRVAESIIEQLFLTCGYKVFRFGMENVLPEVMKDINKGYSNETTKSIRRMPDFVVQDKKGNVFFIEVKFRKNGRFKYRNLKDDDYPYKECYFVVVSKKFIQCVSYEDLRDRGIEVTDKTKYYIANRKEFDLDREVVKQFCGFVHMFFGNT